MNEETRQYIEEVVKTFESRFKNRANQSRLSGGYGPLIRDWEKRLYDRAKAILKANPRERT